MFILVQPEMCYGIYLIVLRKLVKISQTELFRRKMRNDYLRALSGKVIVHLRIKDKFVA